MPLPTITTLPTPPARSDVPSLFNTNADAFLGSFPNLVAQLNAYAAALPAAITGTDFSGTSTTSVLIGTGAKTFTTQTGKQFQIGQPLRVANTAAPSNYMDAQVTAYNSATGQLDLSVSVVGGTGTFAAWTIALLPSGGGAFASLTGAETLTNKSLTTPVLTGTAAGIVAGRIGYASGALTYGNGAVQRTVVNLDEAQTFTTKTLAFGSNTISGTLVQFNTACTDADFVSLTGVETLTNKTLTAPVINNGTITGATIRADCTVNDTGAIAAASPGFRGLPVSLQTQGVLITQTLADASKMVPNTAGGWTIPANASVPFPIGTVLTFVNSSASSQTVSIATDTMTMAGTTTTGTRTVAGNGIANALKTGTTAWLINGNIS